ncbi:uncharacterized protein LOC143185492 [Calliopsis andreniformis]|uniref:uncharacterized protein LOC143185492 n=1 Tax=Calliopsis andreniformis TaxID=337506 RepID=UPI003FCE2C7C
MRSYWDTSNIFLFSERDSGFGVFSRMTIVQRNSQGNVNTFTVEQSLTRMVYSTSIGNFRFPGLKWRWKQGKLGRKRNYHFNPARINLCMKLEMQMEQEEVI